jgi:hemoglobin
MTSASPAAELPDITDRADLVRLVDGFYARVRSDAKLGPVFDDVAQVDWAKHLPKLYDFWDTVLFRANTFRGNLVGAHARLIPEAGMKQELFDHWLALFRQTVEENFSGVKAGHIIRCAEDMAAVIHGKIHAVPACGGGIPDARFDPARLTDEQRQRYAKYREG